MPGRLRGVAASVVLEHRWVLYLAGSYILAGGVVLTVLGRPWPIRLISPTFLALWLTGSLSWLCWQYLRHPRLFRAAIAPERSVGALLVCLLVVPFQVTFQSLKQAIGPTLGFRWDRTFSDFDMALHGRPPWEVLRPLLSAEKVTRGLDWLYLAWFPMLMGMVLWLSWTARRQLRIRALLAVLILWAGAGTIAAALASSAGPCYFGTFAGAPNPYEPLFVRLDEIGGHTPLLARRNQTNLLRLASADTYGVFAGISAMPSLHVAAVVLFSLIAWGCRPLWGALLAAYALSVQIGSVVLGWHYAIDGYVGALLAWGCWTLAGPIAQTPRAFEARAPQARASVV
jgi:membrane-associated phospholipid phosphatase